jgi:TniQ
MVGYYPHRQEEELLYSTTSRAVAILNPLWSERTAAQHLLGARDLTFGRLLPNNSQILRKNIPSICRFTPDSVIDGSPVHLLLPLLEEWERPLLLRSLTQTVGAGSRNWFAKSERQSRELRYCLHCAREDAAAKRPQIWRVLPNFPGACCCTLHRCYVPTALDEFQHSLLYAMLCRGLPVEAIAVARTTDTFGFEIADFVAYVVARAHHRRWQGKEADLDPHKLGSVWWIGNRTDGSLVAQRRPGIPWDAFTLQ